MHLDKGANEGILLDLAVSQTDLTDLGWLGLWPVGMVEVGG